MGWITSHLLLVRTNGARQQRDEGGEDGSRRMPKTRRRHPGWKRGDRADVNIPPAELLFQKETRMRYVGPNDSSCLDAMLSSSVTSIRRRKRGMLYLILANSREDDFQQLTPRRPPRSSWYQFLRERPNPGERKEKETEIKSSVERRSFRLSTGPHSYARVLKKRSENRGLT